MGVYYFTIVSLASQGLEIASKGLFYFNKQFLLEYFGFRLMDENVIHTDAGLPTIKEFTENDPFDGTVDVGSFVDNDRAFSS